MRVTHRVYVAAYHLIRVVIAEQDCAGRAHRIDRRVNGAVAIAPEPMSSHPVGVHVITAALAHRIQLIGQSRRRVRHYEFCDRAADTYESLLYPTGRHNGAGKIPRIIDPQYRRKRRIEYIEVLVKSIEEKYPWRLPDASLA